MLGTGEAAREAAGRYRMLLITADDAARTDPFSDRDMESLRNYARWTLISLQMLAEDETVPQISRGHPEGPGIPGEDAFAWSPEPLPPGWWDIELADRPGNWPDGTHPSQATGTGARAEQPASGTGD
jgi:hypothetical protein